MTKEKNAPAGYLAFVLHAHLPWVINHGTWPHGTEWLYEAAAETYLPLLRVLGNLQRDQVPANFNINLSPILLEQLAHPVFRSEFPRYVTRKIVSSREDEAFFMQAGEGHLAETARFWHRFFTTTLEDFQALDGRIIDGFRRFQAAGMIEILTSGATHGYMPLLGTDESVRAQVRIAIQTHIRHIGEAPRGIWAPECGYRPAGLWNYPVLDAGGAEPHPGFNRIGIEQALSESSIDYFFVDTHLVEESARTASPYGRYASVSSSSRYKPSVSHPRGQAATLPTSAALPRAPESTHRNLYQPYYVDGPYTSSEANSTGHAATIFPRDPCTGLQVWSGETGYPGDANYLDFHKKRFPGGHRYWQVTGGNIDIGQKHAYWPQQGAERVKIHADHFVQLVYDALSPTFNDPVPPILTAPFDAELFGHWWFEGPLWLEAVCRALHQRAEKTRTSASHAPYIETITSSRYLDRYPRAGFISMQEGSWGAEGNNHVWMNTETSWTYTHIYPAELFVRELCTGGHWKISALSKRIAQQLCRELLLLESSDWQFLITTGAARDYAEMRFLTHNDQFLNLKAIWRAFEAHGNLDEEQTRRLTEIEERDNIFPDIDPALWAEGAHDSRPEARSTADAKI